MHDEGTDDTERPREEPPEPPLPPLPPPPPITAAPPGTPAPTAAGWQRPAPEAWGPEVRIAPRLDVGLIVGRTFDTLGREWSLFLALAIPAGLSGLASSLLTPSLQQILRDPSAQTALDQAGFFVVQVLLAALSGVSAIAMIVAADAYWRGGTIGLGASVSRAVRLLPRAIGFLVIAILVLGGLTLALFLPIIGVGLLGAAGIALGVILLLVVLVVLAWIGARLSLLFPVLVLESVPVLGVIGRTWALTRGHAILLFVTGLLIGLCGLLPSWGGTMFSLFVEDRLVAGIATGLASMVIAPLSGIWTVLAWGQLTGAPHADSEVMATGRGRWVALALIAGVGIVLMLAGGALGAVGSDEFRRLSEGI